MIEEELFYGIIKREYAIVVDGERGVVGTVVVVVELRRGQGWPLHLADNQANLLDERKSSCFLLYTTM